MKYVMLVSHGMFAPGLHDTLKMFAGGDGKDIISVSLENGMGTDVFAENVKKKIADITADDEIIVLADIVGGSPLTTTANVLAETGLLGQATFIGGMNLPLALSTVLSKDAGDTADMVDELMEDARAELKPFSLALEDDDEEL